MSFYAVLAWSFRVSNLSEGPNFQVWPLRSPDDDSQNKLSCWISVKIYWINAFKVKLDQTKGIHSMVWAEDPKKRVIFYLVLLSSHINSPFQSITQLVILKSFLKSEIKNLLSCQERPGFERQIKKHPRLHLNYFLNYAFWQI